MDKCGRRGQQGITDRATGYSRRCDRLDKVVALDHDRTGLIKPLNIGDRLSREGVRPRFAKVRSFFPSLNAWKVKTSSRQSPPHKASKNSFVSRGLNLSSVAVVLIASSRRLGET
jgi:hypothetical protein